MREYISPKSLISETKRARIKRDKQIVADRAKWLSRDGAMATAVVDKLTKKYGLSRGTILKICRDMAISAHPTT